MKKNIRLKFIKGDRVIWIIFVIMCLFSLLIVISSTASLAYKLFAGDMTHYLMSHFKHLLGGAIMVLFLQYVSLDWWRKWSSTIFFITILILGVTAVYGVALNSAPRWFGIANNTFQPSYLAKIMLVMILAIQLSERQKYISDRPLLPPLNPQRWATEKDKERNLRILIKTSLPILMPVALVCILVFPSNFSTAGMVYVCSVAMLYVGRVRKKEIAKFFGVTLLVGVLFSGVLYAMGYGRFETWAARLEGFFVKNDIEQVDSKKIPKMDKVENQVFQSKVAIASGGILGKGPGNSTQRSNLPTAHADCAYAFIVEEYGLVGAILVLLGYLIIFYRSIIIARHSKSAFNSLVVFGLGLTILIQAAVNMCVSVSIAPVTGQSLPILSLGGSSIIATGIALGIIQSVARQNDEERMAEEALNQ